MSLWALPFCLLFYNRLFLFGSWIEIPVKKGREKKGGKEGRREKLTHEIIKFFQGHHELQNNPKENLYIFPQVTSEEIKRRRIHKVNLGQKQK